MTTVRNIRLYGFFSFFDSFDFFAPLRVFYFYQVTGSYSQAALLVSLIWIFSALLEVPTGIFSDFIGRKKTIVFGAATILMGYTFYAVGSQFWILALGTFLHGMGKSFFSGNNSAYVYSMVDGAKDDGKYHHLYGRFNSIESVGYFVAALCSGFLAAYSIHLLMWLCVLTQFCMFVIATQLESIKDFQKQSSNIYQHLKEAFLEIKGNIRLRYLSLTMIFAGSGEASYEFQTAMFNLVWPTWALGIARALQELSSIIGYFFAKSIIKTVGVVNIIMLQTFVSWSGGIIAVILQNVFSPIFIILGIVFWGPYDTATQNLFQKEFTDRQRATIASLNSLGQSIYFAIVLNVAGFVATYSNPFIGLFITQLFFLPVIYYRWKLVKNLKTI